MLSAKAHSYSIWAPYLPQCPAQEAHIYCTESNHTLHVCGDQVVLAAYSELQRPQGITTCQLVTHEQGGGELDPHW